MLHEVTWRSWAALSVFIAAYIALGFWLSSNGTVEYNMYKYGLASLVLTPLILIGVYTAKGSKWWTNNVGSALVQLALGLSWTAWPLAYTFWFTHGVLSNTFVAWCEVSGPPFISLVILRLCWIFSRVKKE